MLLNKDGCSQCPGIRTLQTFSVREETFEGKPHLVVPVIAIVEGVHNEAFYSAAELARGVEAWNDMPIPAFHPEQDGMHVSARTPALIEERRIGRFFGVYFDADGGKVRGEAWIDISKAEKISPETLSYLRSGRPLEVSTALFSDENNEGGEWRGEQYSSTVRNVRPDHLAFLPGGTGACSWADGCGVRANAKKGGAGVTFAELRQQSHDDELKLWKEWDEKILAVAHQNLSGIKGKVEAAEKEGDESKLKVLFNWIRQKLGIKTAEMSHEDTRHKLQGLVDALDNSGWMHFVADVFDGTFVYSARGSNPTESGIGGEEKLYLRGYSVGPDEAVTLKDDAVEVREDKKYIPITANEQDNGKENRTVAKKEAVDGLIGKGFTEEDRVWLQNLEDYQLAKIVPAGQAVPTCLKVNDCSHKDGECAGPKPEEEGTPMTAEQYIENAPGSVKSFLQRAVDREAAIKAKAVEGLLANTRCTFTKDELDAKELGELEQLARLAQVPVDFSGQGGGELKNPVTLEDDKNKVPDMPKVFENA